MAGHQQRGSEGISCPKHQSQAFWASYLAGIRRRETASLLYFSQVRGFPLFIA